MHRIESTNFIRDAQGRNLFTDGPPGTTVNDAWLNTIQEEIANVIEWGGLDLLSKNNDTRDQLRTVLQRSSTNYDVIVVSQSMFNNIVERVSANRYRIKGIYKSVYFKFLIDGYKMAGATSPLSDGDTWGYLETNETVLLFAEPGAYINFSDTAGYLSVNTENCSLYNMHITGLNASPAVNLDQSYYLNANYVTFINCKTSNRYSNKTLYGFRGSATASHNRTSKYIGCSVYQFRTSLQGISGFFSCENLVDCYITELTPSSSCVGFESCINLNNCYVQGWTGTLQTFTGYSTCFNLSNCIISDMTTTTGTIRGYIDCINLNSCRALTFQSDSGTITGFEDCKCVNSCLSDTFITTNNSLIYGFNSCINVSSSESINFTGLSSIVRGFYLCPQISACRVRSIESTSTGNVYAFHLCTQISACDATLITTNSGNPVGFSDCEQISSCRATLISSSGGGTAEGFKDCLYGSSLYTNVAANTGNDFMDTVDATIANKVSTPSIWT